MKKDISSKKIYLDDQTELYKLIVKLFSYWSDWETYHSMYLTKLLPSLKVSQNKANDNEKIILEQIKTVATSEQWTNLEIYANFVYNNEKQLELKHKCFSLFHKTLESKQFVDCYDYINFNDLFNDDDKNKLIAELNKEIEVYVKDLKNEIDRAKEGILNNRIVDKFNKSIVLLPENKQLEIKSYLANKIDIFKVFETLKNLLVEYKFKDADKYFLKNISELPVNEYENLKSTYIRKWFEEKQNIKINEEQSLSIAKISQNTLITARAGSGKTRTIACRAIYAIEKENIKPEEIMLLAFNRKAAEEIQHRISDDFNYKTFNSYTARTFHSLAWAIVNPQEEPIWDDKDSDVKQKLTIFIQNLYKSKNIWNDEFKEKLYDLYRNDESDITQDFIMNEFSEEEKYIYLRNKKRITLDGNKVDSNGEKWIADFLFEHDIKYRHAKLLTYSKTKLYKPDFTLFANNKNYVIEHWGIDENDSFKQVAKNFRKSWDEYYEEMQWKRRTCRLKEIPLIETSISDMQNGRKQFEKILKERLENNNIICKKLPKHEILNRIEAKFKDKIAKRFANFIQYAQKMEISPNELRDKLKVIPFSPKDTMFLELAIDLYSEYKNELKKQNKTDFDNVLKEAINKIEQTKGCCEILIGKQIIRVKDIKFLLIDEFQDFSRLFYNLIDVIRKYNPDIKLFCVGDDWQAINGFAGSNLKYFKQYDMLYNNSGHAELLYNYRSARNIVDCANAVMKGQGSPAVAFNKDSDLQLENIYIDDVDYKNADNNIDIDFIYDNDEKKYFNLQHRYLKQCFEIIKQKISKNYIILHRKSKLCNSSDLNLNTFKNALVERLVEYMVDVLKDRIIDDISYAKHKFKKALEEKIQCDTIHQFKGSEADVVIILECNNDNFPLMHPDNEIGLIFDRTIKDVLAEELHLFYVAITRAKQQVYFISEKGNESDFLLNIRSFLNIKEDFDTTKFH